MRLDRRGWHADRLPRLRREYRESFETGGADAERRREAEIARLDSKDWKGRRVFRLRCEGPFGRGPHDVWVEEAWLWTLIDLRRFLCPYHR